MFNIKMILTSSLLLSAMLLAQNTYLTKEKLSSLKDNGILKRANISVIEGIDEGKTYFLQLEVKGKRGTKQINCFIDKETGFTYTGKRYDKKGIPSVFPMSPERVAVLKKVVEEGSSFTYGKGSKHLYLFTDPECPYCIKFEKSAKGLLEDYTVHVILYPLKFHKKAPAMTEWIMQGADDKEKHQRMEELMVDNSAAYTAFLSKDNKPFKYTNTVKDTLDKGAKAVKALKVTGTPMLFDENMTKINWGALLNSEKQKKEATKTK